MAYLLAHRDEFGHGVLLTLGLLALGWSGAVVMGTVVAGMRVSSVRAARVVAAGYILVFRNVPLPVQMVVCAFGLPLIGLTLPLFQCATLALVVYTAPFVAELVRSGINTVSSGELEACRALGLSPLRSMRHVVIPQALATTTVPMGNLMIMTFKNTSVAAVVGVAELTFAADKVAIAEVRPFAVLTGAAVAYVVIGLGMRRVVTLTERKVAFAR